MARWVVVALLVAGCGDGDASTNSNQDPRACNGSRLLCDRPYSEVAFATTHNAMSNAEAGWLAPNQTYPVPRQLADGVRGLMLDVHYLHEEATLCHGLCEAGSRPLSDGLAEIRAFMDDHPGEVITIIFESYVAAADAATAFADSGLDGYAYAHPAGMAWPTLGEMIEAGERLVVFTDHEGGDPPWYHPVWDHCFETHYHYEQPEEMDCAVNRGDPGNALFILNHFLTFPVADVSLAEQVNPNPFFVDRALRCRDDLGRIPNFVTVDFYEIGDLFAVVGALNDR